MSELKTRAGLQPTATETPFQITTEKAEEYLQKKFDAVTQMMRKEGKQQSDVKVILLTMSFSKKYKPFILITSKNVLKDRNDKHNDEEASIFNPEATERLAKIKDEYYVIFKALQYNEADEKAFFSHEWRNALKISLKTSQFLKEHRRPKLQRFNKNRNEYVACMIDPMRLFHDMLVDLNDPNGNQKFNVDVGEVEKIKSTNYRYDVYRYSPKAKNKNNRSEEERIAFELDRRIQSGRG